MLSIGQQFTVNDRGYDKLVFTVKRIAKPDSDNPQFDATAVDLEGIPNQVSYCFPQCGLLVYAERGELTIMPV